MGTHPHTHNPTTGFNWAFSLWAVFVVNPAFRPVYV